MPIRPPPRTQSGKISAFLATVPGFDRLSGIHLSNLVHASMGQLCYVHQIVYRAGDLADAYYIIVRGGVTLMDLKDKDNVDEGKKEWVERFAR